MTKTWNKQPISDEVVHQLERVAEDASDDELFEQEIDGHEWHNGILMFLI